LDDALEKVGQTPSVPQSQAQWEFLEEYGKKLGLVTIKGSTREKKQSAGLATFFKRWQAMSEWFTE
jgi:hypothetical protein